MTLAETIVKTVLTDLSARKGIGNALEQLGQEGMDSLKATLESKVQTDITKHFEMPKKDNQ